MSKNILTKEVLTETQKHFMTLCEYLLPNNMLLDEDDDLDNEKNMGQQEPPQGPSEEHPQVPSQEQSDSESMNTQDDNQMGQEQNQPTTDNGGDVNGFNPTETNDDSSEDFSVEDSGDEVIDIDDLTKSQEDSDAKITDLSGKFDKLASFMDNIENYIKKNESNIDSLRGDISSLTGEIEKRNPTDLEKLEMRAKDSYPFNVKPDDYWKEKEKTSNYVTGGDTDEENDREYTITQGDVQSATDWKSIADSLNKNTNLNPNLSNIFKY